MGRRRSLPVDQRQRAVGVLEGGMGVREVARRLGVAHSTISRLQTRYQQTGSVKDRPRRGRDRITSAQEDRYIVLTSRRNRFLSAPKLARQLYNAQSLRVSKQTVRNRLHAAGLRGRKPYVGIPLTARHRQLRLQWARNHRRWIQRRWNRVVFSDESRFNVQFSDGRLRVWRRKGERYDMQNVMERDRYGGGSVTVWGGIMHGVKTDLVTVIGTLTAVDYCNQIVVPHIAPFVRRHNATLQQDNARPHTARHTQGVFLTHGIQKLEWPARSPDLSPIEHMWDILGRRVRSRNDVHNVRTLERALHEEWQNIPIADVNKLIASMRKRCTAVIRANGGHTQY